MTVVTKIRRADFDENTWQQFVDEGLVDKWEAAGMIDNSPGRTALLGETWAQAAVRNTPPSTD